MENEQEAREGQSFREAMGSTLAGRFMDWAHLEVDAIRASKGLPPWDWRATHMEGPKYYCVMCLDDGDKVAATHLVAGKGYCKSCAASLVKNGHAAAPIPGEAQQKPHRAVYSKITEEQRAEIVASKEKARVLAARYSVSDATIYNIRNAAKATHAAVPSSAPTDATSRASGTTAQLPAVTIAPHGTIRLTIDLDVTEERADAVWRSLPLQEKAEFVRGKVLERWPSL